MGTKQNVETTNFLKFCFSPSEQLTFITIDKPGGHQILRIRKPYKEWCRTKTLHNIIKLIIHWQNQIFFEISIRFYIIE